MTVKVWENLGLEPVTVSIEDLHRRRFLIGLIGLTGLTGLIGLIGLSPGN